MHRFERAAHALITTSFRAFGRFALLHLAVNQRSCDAGEANGECASHEVARKHRAARQMPGQEERRPRKQDPDHDTDDGARADIASQRTLAVLADEQQPAIDQEADHERGDSHRSRENHCKAVHEDADRKKGRSRSRDAQKEANFLLHVYALLAVAKELLLVAAVGRRLRAERQNEADDG